MIEKLKRLLAGPTGVYIAALIAIAGSIAIFYTYRSSGDDFSAASQRMYIDPATGKVSEQTVAIGKQTTGVPAEACFWNADGSPKKLPTYVMLNRYAGKPEPTFCPDCGRLVLLSNSPPITGQPSPPTRAEYEKDPKKYPLN